MAKKLVIVESPAKSKTIGKFLGSDYEITASFGHVRDLPNKKLGVDIENNFEPSYTNMRDKSKVLTKIKSLVKESEEIYIATDPDREGEAIAWHIIHAAKMPEAKVRRIVFNEITETAVQSAITNCRDVNMKLVDAQQARRVLDRLIGYKLSPVLSKKIRRGLSAGRVQSVAVKIVCDREAEIDAFEPEEYWVITLTADTEKKETLELKLFAEGSADSKLEVNNEKDATKIVASLEKAAYSVDSITTKAIRRNPAPPFITSTLQQEASRKLNWSAKKTMMIAQQLYEGLEIDGEPVGLITYMRTDSTRLSDDAKSAAKSFIIDKYGEEFWAKEAKKQKKNKNTQDAHEAVRPSYLEHSPDKLKATIATDHYKLYKLIWDRFLASQMTQAVYDRTTVIVKGASDKDYFLRVTGNVLVFEGFTAVYMESKDDAKDDEERGTLPKLAEKETLTKKEVDAEQKFTQPPSRYTEASLVKTLEEKGIGRPSTYAPTISTIQDRGYVDKEGKSLFPTDLGKLVNSKLEAFFQNIIDSKFTADMETKLDEIMEGKHTWQTVVGDFYGPFSEKIDIAYKEMEKVNTDRPTDEKCELCSHDMVIKAGRFGDFMACTNFPECKNTKSMARELDIPCPKCKEPIIEKKTKRGKVFFGCSGFPKCKFATWNEPIQGPCPSCNFPVLQLKQLKGGKVQKICDECETKFEATTA